MSVQTRPYLAAVLTLAVMAGAARGQPAWALEELRTLPERPRSRGELDHLEARKHYALGLLCERGQKIEDALRHFEAAVRLDPDAASPRKALIPIYLVLERKPDAMAACRQVLQLDPGDYETWYFYARELQSQGRLDDAAKAMSRALASPELKNNPEVSVPITFDLSRLYEDSKEYDRALAVLEKLATVMEEEALDVRPAEVYESVGRICVKAGRYSRAVAALEKARAGHLGQDPVAVSRLDLQIAKAYEAQGKNGEALQHLDDYLRTQPPGLEPYELKVSLLKRLGRDREVLPSLQEAAARDSHNVELKLFLARQFVEHKEPTAAERIYVTLAADSPTPDVYRGLFTLYRNEGKMTNVLKLLDQTFAAAGLDQTAKRSANSTARSQARSMIGALADKGEVSKELIPAARARLRSGARLQPETLRFLALVATESRQFDDAEELWRACLKDAVTPETEPAIYDGLLKVLWATEKHEAVVEACRTALIEAKHTDPALFHTNLARAWGLGGKTDEALKEADQAIEKSKGEARILRSLLRIEILQTAERFDQAEKECRALLKESQDPEIIRRIRYILSGVLSAANQFAKAEEQLRLVLKEDPDDATANNDLGYIMADHGKNLGEAEQLIRKAIQLDKEQREAAKDEEDNQPNAAYIDSLGWVLFRRGRLDEARREMEKAVALPEGASDPVVWDHLGDVYFGLGDRRRAREAWEKSKALFEKDRRRRRDEHYQELKTKLQLLEPESHR
jgi:tetratricopeptide (TPR) repeat protein